MQGVCGAVTGALMVIGLKHGRVKAGDRPTQEKTYALIKELLRRFTVKNGGIICRNLLGLDISTPEGMKEARGRGLFVTACPKYVRDAGEILEEIL